MTLVVAILLALFVLPAPWGLVAVVAALVVELGEAMLLVRWSRRRRSTVGAEALVDRRAIVVEACRPVGRVRLQGELWAARCAEGADAGDAVRVVELDGLTLVVARD